MLNPWLSFVACVGEVTKEKPEEPGAINTSP